MWVNLEDIMLSEMSPTQEDAHCVIPLVGGALRESDPQRQGVDGGPRGWGGFNEDRVSVWEAEKVLEVHGECTQCHLTVLLKTG